MKLTHKRSGYTIVENEALLDPQLSMRAKGLLAILLSRPDGWDFRIAWLVRVSKDGRDSVRSTIRELEEAGYLVRKPVKDPNTGQWSGYDWELVSPSGREGANYGESGRPHIAPVPSETEVTHTGAYGETGAGEAGAGQSGRRAIRPPGSSDALKKTEVIKTEKPQKEKETPPNPPKPKSAAKPTPTPSGRSKAAKRKKPKSPASSKSSGAAEPEVPDWVPEDLWTDWVTYRKEIGKPLTPTSVRQQIRYLEQWRKQYGEEAALGSIRRSIARGWRGLFEPKPEKIISKIAKNVPNDNGTPDGELRRVADDIMRAFGGGAAPRKDPDVLEAEWRPALEDGADGA